MRRRTTVIVLVFGVTTALALLYSPALSWLSVPAGSADGIPGLSSTAVPKDTSLDMKHLLPLQQDIDAFEKEQASHSSGQVPSDGAMSKWYASKPQQPHENVVWRLVFATQDTSVEHLVFSKELNPRERPVTDRQWQALESLFEPYRGHLEKVAHYRGDTLAEELNSLQAQGSLRESVPRDELSQEAWRKAEWKARQQNKMAEEEGASNRVTAQKYFEGYLTAGTLDPTKLGYTKRTVGEKVYYFRTRDSASYQAVTSYYAYRAQEAAFVVIAWFQTNGFLTFDESSRLARRTTDLANNTYGQ